MPEGDYHYDNGNSTGAPLMDDLLGMSEPGVPSPAPHNSFLPELTAEKNFFSAACDSLVEIEWEPS